MLSQPRILLTAFIAVFAIFSLFALLYFILITPVFATTPPNSPKQLTPPHNASWSDSQAIASGDITFTWQNNGDAENNPLWFYFYLIKWNGSSWVVDTKTYTSAQGVTTITKNLSAGFYAWQVAAVDATKSSTPWHAWADLNQDGQVTSADWSFLVVKSTSGGGGGSGGIGAIEAPTTCGATIKHICTSATCPDGEARNYATIQDFVDAAQPGWTGQIQNGIYAENISILRNGTAANPICLRAKAGHSPVLEKTSGSGINFAFAGNPIPISYWIVEGLEIRGYSNNGIWIRGTGSHHITIRNNYIHHVGGVGGIQVRSAGGQILIENNVIEEVATVKLDGMTKMSCPNFPDSNQHCHAIYFGDGTAGSSECNPKNPNNTIRRNLIRKAPGSGIQFRYTNCGSSSGAEITDSLVENNIVVDTGNGFNIGGRVSDSVFRNNTVIMTNNAPSRDSNFRALWNTVGNKTLVNKVYNNVFYASGDSVWAFNIQNNFPFDTNIFDNNIWTGMADRWVWLGTSRNDFNSNYKSVTGWDANGKIGADPKFVGTNNFHLQSSSPARNAGANAQCPLVDFDGVSRPQENICDIGAYEYKP